MIKSRQLSCFLATCAVAVAGAVAVPVYASDVAPSPTDLQDFQPTPFIDEDLDHFEPTPTPNIASESESVGEFGTDDTFVDDILGDLIDDVSGSGFDFVSPSPTPSTAISPVESPTPGDFLSPGESPAPLVPDLDPYAPPDPPPLDPVPGDDDASFYASYDTYYGSISSTYLEFMRGFLPKLGFREHYVASRTSQYDYIFAFGDDLSFDGGRFVGNGITVVTWNTYHDGSYSVGYESSFSLDPGPFLVYSDLSDRYPSLADTAGFTLRQILILLTTFILGVVIDHMYQVRKVRRIK